MWHRSLAILALVPLTFIAACDDDKDVDGIVTRTLRFGSSTRPARISTSAMPELLVPATAISGLARARAVCPSIRRAQAAPASRSIKRGVAPRSRLHAKLCGERQLTASLHIRALAGQRSSSRSTTADSRRTLARPACASSTPLPARATSLRSAAARRSAPEPVLALVQPELS